VREKVRAARDLELLLTVLYDWNYWEENREGRKNEKGQGNVAQEVQPERSGRVKRDSLERRGEEPGEVVKPLSEKGNEEIVSGRVRHLCGKGPNRNGKARNKHLPQSAALFLRAMGT